jgi:acetylornithine deacetylase/succinyl-diaminopimelate desuccinylase-like protein
VGLASAFAKVSTAVPLGWETFLEPDDPKLISYVQGVVRPELDELGLRNLIDVPRNNLVVQLGSGETDAVLLIQNYTVVQHHNLMENPDSGVIANAGAYGIDAPAIFGQGVSQTKGHQAVMLAVLRSIVRSRLELRGTLYWAVNNEGLSSHLSSEAILNRLDRKPSFCLLQRGTGLRLSLGNRGRVDVNVHVTGTIAHSSEPSSGLSAIEGAREVMNRLRLLSWMDTHPQLGVRQAIPYKVRFEPLAPHTLPSDADIVVDRRLLPGDDPDAAADEIRGALEGVGPWGVEVTRGFYMLPALVPPDDPWVQSLQASVTRVRGEPAETFFGQGSFDAGGPLARGIPTVMYGASGGVWPVGVDFVTIADLMDEARVLAHLILRTLL